MARDPDEEWREALVQLLGRPVLLIFWSLVLWGTLYGSLLIHAAATEGLRATLQRILSGRDLLGGLANLTLAAGAAVVWIGVGVAVWHRRHANERRAPDGKS